MTGSIRSTKRLWCLVLPFAFASAMATPVHTPATCPKPVNLVVNGGFELGAYSPSVVPDNWVWDAWAGLAVHTWDDTQAQSGHKSVKISSQALEDARFIQDVMVKRDTLYALSGWIKSENVGHTAESVDAGANIALMGGYTYTRALFGTQDWTPRSLVFNSETHDTVSVAARLGFYSGTTTGTAWFDNLALAEILPMDPHPRWNILVLIYRQTDFTFTDDQGVPHHVVASMAPGEVTQAADAATQFVTKDIPQLSSFNMMPRLTIRYPQRPLSSLGPNGGGWWPDPGSTAQDRDPAFDSVIVIWDPRATDQATGQPIWIGSAAGLTPNMGNEQTYTTLIIEAATSYGHRNVFKHEFGHSLLEYFDVIKSSPKPKVENHTDASQYVNCQTGKPYVWEDETLANPIANSIYNNTSGFTHDYYSGTTALATDPSRCLGIARAMWAYGGPITHPGSDPDYTNAQRIQAIIDQMAALADNGQLPAHHSRALQQALKLAAKDLARHWHWLAAVRLKVVALQIQGLVKHKALSPQVADLLLAAVKTAMSCR